MTGPRERIMLAFLEAFLELPGSLTTGEMLQLHEWLDQIKEALKRAENARYAR